MPPRVVIPSTGGTTTRLIRIDKVQAIVSNRIKDGREEYLVRWRSNSDRPPMSWHGIEELIRCLEAVQEYIATCTPTSENIANSNPKEDLSSNENGDGRLYAGAFNSHDPASGKVDSRLPSTTLASSTSREPLNLAEIDVYNGILDADEDGLIFARSASGQNIVTLNVRDLKEMSHKAHQFKTDHAHVAIRAEYTRRLQEVRGKRIRISNSHDLTTPSLRFKYIDDYVLRDGVFRADPATQEGCQQCSPHMGRDIGCEYTQRCGCLEYAKVDEARLASEEMMQNYKHALTKGGSTMGLPKKFPYYCQGTKTHRAGTLVPFYLESRFPIYECNDNCNCGRFCRNKNVQFGRQVEVDIFKTDNNRGWGLRCMEKLHKGQFIDTYRGEIITDEEATRREETGGILKASYLYSLDKHAESEGFTKEEIYVVDGELMGGPSKFINHSCQPNCRQYTVSYNKHDTRIYDIAFFAIQDIPAGEELTFDYLDKEDVDVEESAPEGAVPCLCGAQKCRKWLWQ